MTKDSMIKNRFGLAVCVCGLLIASGCGSSREYDLVPVSGIVSLNGKPLSRAVVIFQPTGGGADEQGPGSTTKTDDAGHFELRTTFHDELGAMPGPHRVQIFGSQEVLSGSKGDDEDVVYTKQEVPSRYNARSELTFQVPPEGTDQADFELTSP